MGQTELILGELKKASEVLSREQRKTKAIDGAVETILSTAKRLGRQHHDQREGASRD